ncbi:MAG: hypothetical protein IT462_12410 [Planctomycetes bacterium]|nr:hypothetical protein [Planctomycetota bacterium]
MRRFLYENSLSIVMLGLFVLFLAGQLVFGWMEYNSSHPLALSEYVTSGEFIEATFENWESEFLQMAVFVILTKWLRQWGSSESKPPYGKDAVDEDPRKHRHDPKAPWPVRKGGLVLRLYEHSLSASLLLLFAFSFGMHALGGARQQIEEGRAITTLQYMATPKFWFESFQNWQSEFLSVGALILLSIYLRERGSPQSKPVAKEHWKSEDE